MQSHDTIMITYRWHTQLSACVCLSLCVCVHAPRLTFTHALFFCIFFSLSTIFHFAQTNVEFLHLPWYFSQLFPSHRSTSQRKLSVFTSPSIRLSAHEIQMKRIVSTRLCWPRIRRFLHLYGFWFPNMLYIHWIAYWTLDEIPREREGGKSKGFAVNGLRSEREGEVMAIIHNILRLWMRISPRKVG